MAIAIASRKNLSLLQPLLLWRRGKKGGKTTKKSGTKREGGFLEGGFSQKKYASLGRCAARKTKKLLTKFCAPFFKEIPSFFCGVTRSKTLAAPQPLNIAFPLGNGGVLRSEEEGDSGRKGTVGRGKKKEKGTREKCSEKQGKSGGSGYFGAGWMKGASWGRVNREVQTVNWEGGGEGAGARGVKSSLKKAHKPWIRGKKGAQTVN